MSDHGGPYKSADEELQAEFADEMGMVDLLYVRLKLPAILSRQEMRAFLDAPKLARDRLLLRVLYSTGMRSGEACTFRWCDVSFDNGTIFVRDSKAERDRYVCADEETMRMLRDGRKKAADDVPVFGITTVTVGNVVERTGKATGLLDRFNAMNRRFSPHAIRHTFATHMYENGMGLVDLQILLGHTFIDTTRVYVHVGIAHTMREYHRLHPLCRGPVHDDPHGDAGAMPGVSTGLHCHDGQEG